MEPAQPMISLERAVETVLSNATPLPPVEVAIDAAAGRVLAEDIVSDTDMPPFNKAAMDGYAVRADDVAAVPSSLEVIETLAAGCMPQRAVRTGQCTRIMTGAPVPEGADTVVMVEHTESAAGGRACILQTAPRGRNVCLRGEDVRKGQAVVGEGSVLNPFHVALAAAAGRARVRVYGTPAVAILATGDEIVEPDRVPDQGQVRDSNSHALASRLRQSGVQAECLGIVPDHREALRRALEEGLKRDVLIVSGGVSMGDHDLVPGILSDLSVELIFQQIAVKPGRPTVFGRRGKTLVFALPGNPVSALVIAELVLMPALRRMMGETNPAPAMVEAVLDEPLSHKGQRTSFRPVVLRWCGGSLHAAPVEYHGSADLAGAARGNAFAAIPGGTKELADGSKTQVLNLPWSRL